MGTTVAVAGAKIGFTTIQRSLALWTIIYAVLYQSEPRGDRATLLGAGVTERASRTLLKKVDDIWAYLSL